MMAPMDEALRQANVDSWRTGRCFPWWRDRPGYDRIEPWPPAALTQLGRRLLGLDDWREIANRPPAALDEPSVSESLDRDSCLNSRRSAS